VSRQQPTDLTEGNTVPFSHDYFATRQLCAKVTNLVLRCIALVLFPDDDPLQIETFANIQWDVAIEYIINNSVHFICWWLELQSCVT
jgi:hypothetical protein